MRLLRPSAAADFLAVTVSCHCEVAQRPRQSQAWQRGRNYR